MPNLSYHPILREIITKLDFARIDTKVVLNQYYDSTEQQPGYTSDTIFAGKKNGEDWISVNIIEGYDELFLHTSLKLISSNNLVVDDLRGFDIGKKNTLFRVDKLNKPVNDLISKIENDIFPYL